MERYRIVEGVGLYYLTFTVVEWLPVFIDETACQIIVDSFNFCITNKHLRVNSYVIMPTHLHAVAFDSEFDPKRLKHTLMTCGNSPGGGCLTIPRVICQSCSPSDFRKMLGRIVSAGSGSHRSIPWGFSPTSFGSKRWTTCTIIHAAGDWCGCPKIGGFLPPGFG